MHNLGLWYYCANGVPYSLGQIRIFIGPVSQIIFFLEDISTVAQFFIKCVKKAKFFKNSSKMGPYLSKKLALMIDDVIRTRETSIILNPTFGPINNSVKCFCQV